jgi:hypothetical protein
MPAGPGRRDGEDMNTTIGANRPARASVQAHDQARRDILALRRDPSAAFAATLIGSAAIAASGWAAEHTASAASLRFTGGVGPHARARAYADAHLADVAMASHPLLTMACGLLVTAATALAFTRHRGLAAVLVGASAAIPWIPAAGFLDHAWQLAQVSTRG